MFATAEVVTGEALVQAIVIPSSAVQRIEGKPAAFVQQDDGSFVKRDLELGKEIGDRVEVKAGLKEGDRVAIREVHA